MTFWKTGVPKTILVLLAVLFSLLLVSFIFVSKVILPREVHNYLEGVSKDKGYEIRVKDIEFGLFTGIKGREIEISDPLSLVKPILKIREVAIMPDILPSLRDWKIRVRGIVIDRPILLLTKEELSNLMKLTGAGEYEGKKKRPFPIEIEHVEIRNAQIEVIPGVSLVSKKIELSMKDAHPEEEKTIGLSGSVTLLNNELEIEGRIKPFLEAPIGELKINLSELNTESFSNAFKPLIKLAVFSDLRFQISDSIDSQGIIDLAPSGTNREKNSDFSGRLEYDLHYDKSTDTAFIGSLNLNVDKLIRLSIEGNIEKVRTEGIFDLEGKAEGIELESLAKWFPALSNIEFSGNAGAKDIRVIGSIEDRNVRLSGNVTLNKVNIRDRKNDFQIDGLEGRLEAISARFINENMEDFYTELFFSARDLKVETRGRTIRTSRAESTRPLRIVFSHKPGTSGLPEDGNPSGSQKADSTLERGQNKISIESKGLYYEDLSFDKFSIGKGSVNELSFKLEEDNKWALNLSSTGSQFQIKGEGVYLTQLGAHIQAEKNGELSVWGRMDGKEGYYKRFLFPRLFADFRFGGDSLQITNLKAQIGRYGELRVKELNLITGDGKNRASHKLTFGQGSFSGLNQEVKSKGIKGVFVFYTDKNKTIWDGDIFIQETGVTSQKLNDLSLRVTSSQEGIKLERISGRFLDGDIRGSAVIKTAKSPVFISSHIELERASMPLSKLKLRLGGLKLDFKGSVNKAYFPEGKGEISLINLDIEKDGMTSPLRGNMQIETVGETVLLKEGFIENGEGKRISLTGKMEDSLKGDRNLRIDLPKIPLVFLQKTLSPVLPQALREGESKGDIGLSLNISRFLEEGTSLNGRVSIKDASFVGEFNGTPFLINDIDGRIPIKDEGKPPISLVSLIKYSLEPNRLVSKKGFRGFLDLARQDSVKGEEDLLKIKQMEYGFLRLRDIECEVELNKGKINLRRFEPKLYKGRAFGTGVFGFGGKESAYNVSFLFKNISLKGISNSIPSTKDYISGRVNGLAWVRGEGGELKTLDGVFGFWAIESEKEPRRVGKALLTKLGVKERFFLRSYRKYDEGEIQGYIKDGVITFKELRISNTILGIKDLSIRVDRKRNSISAAHFLSVIRETAKRAGRGELKIEFKNK